MIRALLLASGFMGLSLAAPAFAQEIVDGNHVEAVLEAARLYGPANLESQPNGDPMIRGEFDGLFYYASFRNCVDNTNCEDLHFYAGFADNKQPLEVINDWNRDVRFGTAYLDSDLDACISFDLNLEHGITVANLEAAFAVWKTVLDEYATYIGYQ